LGDEKETTHQVFQEWPIILGVPRKVRVELHTIYAVQSASVSSISGKTLRVATHINENITPKNNGSKIVSTGLKEGIYTSGTERLEKGLKYTNSQSAKRRMRHYNRWGPTPSRQLISVPRRRCCLSIF
jgi:hypothetical protein